jgi:hypothetical protein
VAGPRSKKVYLYPVTKEAFIETGLPSFLIILGIIFPPILLSLIFTITSEDPFGQTPDGHFGETEITLLATLITGAILTESLLPH